MERTLDAQDNEKSVIDKVKDKEIELIEKRNEVEELKKTQEEEILKLRNGAARDSELFKLQKEKLEAEAKLLQLQLKEKVIIY